MAILPIYNCFHPILKKKTNDIENIDESIRQLAKDMLETMYNTGNGVGLAGNQVGMDKSILVVDISDPEDTAKYEPIVMINPVITDSSESTIEMTEGCLSVPELYEKVARPEEIDVQYYNLEGKEINIHADGFLSRVIQHEIDHLNGILFFEKLTPLRKTLVKNKLKKIQKGLILPDYPMINPDGKLAQ